MKIRPYSSISGYSALTAGALGLACAAGMLAAAPPGPPPGQPVRAAATAASALAPSDTAATAKLVPQDAVLYVELSRPSEILDRFVTPDMLDRLDSVPQIRQFKQSDQFTQLRGVVTYLETKLGTDWRSALRELTAGGVALAVQPGPPTNALLVVRARDAQVLERTHKALVDLIEADAKQKGNPSPVKSREYKGVTAWSLGPNEFHAILGDTLVFCSHQDGMKKVLEMRAGEGSAALTELAGWREAHDRVPAGSAGWAFVRLDAVRQAGAAGPLYAEKSDNPAAALFLGGLPHLLARAPYAVAVATLDDQHLGVRLELPKSDAWPEAYHGFYASEPGHEAALPLHPARTIASLSFYRDIKAIWDVRDQLVTPQVLPRFTELEANVGKILFGGREFGDVLGEFEPRFRIVAATQDYSRAKNVPEIKVPAFALVLELKHPEEFATELVISYNSIIGLANLGLGQQNQPRLIVTSEQHKGFTIQGARFFDRAAGQSAEAASHIRYNFSPACSAAGRYFVIGSTIDVVKDVLDALGDVHAPPQTTPDNVVLEIDGAAALQALAQNHEPLVRQNMLQEGHTREQAEQQINTLLALARLFNAGEVRWTAAPGNMHVDLSIKYQGLPPRKVATP